MSLRVNSSGVPALALAGVISAALGCAGTSLTRNSELEATRARQEEMLREVAELRRHQEATAGRQSDVQAEVAMTLEDIKTRLDRLENQLRDLLDGLARSRLGPEAPAAPSSAGPGGAPGVTPQAQYEAAYLEVTRGHYDLAVTSFEEFLRQYPTHELADNAVYWIGECYYAQGDYNRAMEAFVRLMDAYPEGDKVPAAMLKLGYAFAEAGDPNAARRYLQRLVDQFPDREEAALARQRLQELP